MTTKLKVRQISATWTPSSSTYLRWDGVWETPAGGGGWISEELAIAYSVSL